MLQPGPVQSTYTQYINVGQIGMLASSDNWEADTKICQDASPPVGIGFGLAVSQGTDSDRAVMLGGASGKAFVGITRADQTLPNVNSAFTDKFQDGDNMGVLVKGDIWVVPENDVFAGEAVYFDEATGRLGATSGGKVLINGSRWMTSALAAGFAVCRLGSSGGNASGT
jgi:hypothetical protein